MKKRTTILVAGSLALACSFAPVVLSGNQHEDDVRSSQSSVLEPGEHHAILDQRIGTWDVEYSYYAPNGEELVRAKGSFEARWTLDGRFLEQRGEHTLGGEKYSEFMLMGYDNFREHYILTYASTFGTGWISATGQGSEDGSTITWRGTHDQPHMNRKDVPYTMVEEQIDRDHRVTKFYQPSSNDPDDMTLLMKMEITRKDS